MSLNFKYIPLTFLKDDNQIKEQIKNTIILKYFFDKTQSIVKLSELIEGTQYGYNASALKSGNNKFLRISDITDGKVNWDSVPFCDCVDEETYLLKEDDILIARTGGTTGKSFLIYDTPEKAIYAGYLIRIRANKDNNPKFLNLFLNSYAYWSQIVSLNKGDFRPSVNANKLKSLVLPQCSPQEQLDAIRISRGESFVGYEDLKLAIEKALTDYYKCNDIILHCKRQKDNCELLKQSILQEAIQGKLTEDWRIENSNVEHASELLKRIKAEKEQLIKNKKIKKEKVLPPISDEEIPFGLPDGWVWCRLGELSINRDELRKPISTSERSRRRKIYDYYGASGIIDKIDSYTHNGLFLLIGEDGSNLKLRSKPIAFEVLGKFWVNNHAHSIQFCNYESLKYIMNYLNGTDLSNYITGGFQPKLNQKNLSNIIISLPPLIEQADVVKNIENITKKCKQIEEEIVRSEENAKMLMQAILKEAFN